MENHDGYLRCGTCGQEKARREYRKGTLPTPPTCMTCSAEKERAQLDMLELEGKERAQKKMLREEIKKLAKQRFAEKKKRKRAAKRAKIEAPYVHTPEAPQIEADPVTIELARRELARRKLLEFIRRFHPDYQAGWVHHDICRRLEKFSADVAAKKSPRLMLLMPPRHGKSEIVSRAFPAWHLGQHPNHEFIGCSYNLALAMGFSRKVRDIIASPEYGVLYPRAKLDPGSRAAESWKLAGGLNAGGFTAAGVDGGITGKGAHILSIDDPFKGIDEADNMDQRQKVWDWYITEAYTRLAPGGGVLIIQTWWNDDDLAGRIQQMMKDADPDDRYVDRFEVVKYPAFAEEDEEFRSKGDPLHPDRFDTEALMKIQATMGGVTSRHWSALYQQNPVPSEGAFFTTNMIVYRSQEPVLDECDVYIAWDFAISEKKVNDWTVGTVIARDHTDTLHVLEQVRFKSNDAGQIVNTMIDLYAKYQHKYPVFGAEDGMIWRTMKSAMLERMAAKKIYINLDDEQNKLSPINDKYMRARPLQGRMAVKKVTFPRGQKWVDDFRKEALRFPGGAHEDTVDSMAWAVILTTRRAPPNAPTIRQIRRTSEKTVKELLAEHAGAMGGGGGHMAA